MVKLILGYAIGPIGSGLLGVITLPLLAWLYSPEDIGRVSMLQVVASLSVLLFTLGMDQAYVREYFETQNRPRLLKSVVSLGLALILVFNLLIFFTSPGLISETLYGTPSVYLSTISSLCFVFVFISRFLSLILRMQEKAVQYSMSQVLPKIIFLVFILLSILFGLKKDIYNLITAHAFSIAAIALILTWTTRQDWVKALTEKIDRDEQRKLLVFGMPLIVGGVASWGLYMLDRVLLRQLSSFEELGIYSVAMSIGGVATLFAGIFNTIWTPLVYKWINDGTDTKKIDQVSEYVLVAVFFVLVLSGLFSWIVPYFLPPKYEKVQYLITICLIGPLVYTLSETTSVGINIMRKTKLSMYASLCAVCASLVGNYFLIPLYGALGAGIATSCSFVLFFIIRTEFSCVVWRKTPRFRTYLMILGLTAQSCLTGLFYSKKSNVMYILWIIILVIGGFIFRSELKIFKDNILKKRFKTE